MKKIVLTLILVFCAALVSTSLIADSGGTPNDNGNGHGKIAGHIKFLPSQVADAMGQPEGPNCAIDCSGEPDKAISVESQEECTAACEECCGGPCSGGAN